MVKLRIVILIASIVFVFSLAGHFSASARGLTHWKQSYVVPGRYARALMRNRFVRMESQQDDIKMLIRILHDDYNFIHISRKHLRAFSKPGFNLALFKSALLSRITQLRAQGGGPEERKRVNKLKKEYDSVDRAYEAYTQGYSQFRKRDWPFCLAGEQHVQFKITDGCASVAKSFVTLANAANPPLFEDVRLIISKSYEGLAKHVKLLGTGDTPPSNINGHQMVLVKTGGVWYLVNATYYREGGKTGVEGFEIFSQIDGRPVDPDTILYKEIILPTERGKLHRLVAAGVGRDRNDDLGVHTWEESVRLGTSIPLAEFRKIN